MWKVKVYCTAGRRRLPRAGLPTSAAYVSLWYSRAFVQQGRVSCLTASKCTCAPIGPNVRLSQIMYLLNRLTGLRLFPLCLVLCSSLPFYPLSIPLIVHVPIIVHIPIGSLHCFGFLHHGNLHVTDELHRSKTDSQEPRSSSLSKHRTRTQSTILILSHRQHPLPLPPSTQVLKPRTPRAPSATPPPPEPTPDTAHPNTSKIDRPTPQPPMLPIPNPHRPTGPVSRNEPFSSLPPNETNPTSIRIEYKTDEDEESPGAAWESSQVRDHPGGNLGQHHAPPEQNPIQRDHFPVSKPGATASKSTCREDRPLSNQSTYRSLNQTVAKATATHTCKDGPFDPRAVHAGIRARHPSISTCPGSRPGLHRLWFPSVLYGDEIGTGSGGHTSRLCERFVRDGRPGSYRPFGTAGG